MRSRQNKLIENEALAEVQLAAFPWESLSLSLRPSLENERGGGGDTLLRNPVVPWTRIRKRRASKPLLRRKRRLPNLPRDEGGRGAAWPITTDGRAEKQSYPLREAGPACERRPSENRVIRSRASEMEWKGEDDPYLLALFFAPSFDAKIERRGKK